MSAATDPEIGVVVSGYAEDLIWAGFASKPLRILGTTLPNLITAQRSGSTVVQGLSRALDRLVTDRYFGFVLHQ